MYVTYISLDSPSTSLEAVGAPTAGQGTVPVPRQWVDSETETGDLEDWSSNVAADTLQTLSKAEKERQEIINGDFNYFLVHFTCNFKLYRLTLYFTSTLYF